MKKLLLAAMIAGCVSGVQAYDLKILHINDHHSHLDADDGMDLMLAGEETRVKSGGMARVATMFKNLGNGNNVLKLHAGDAITGTLYYTTTKGKADAAAMNQICFDAFVVGNHEFDGGDSGLVNFLNFLNPASNNPCSAATPVLGANVVPEKGVSPLSPADGNNYLSPYVIKEVNGEKIGIIGIVIADKTKNSSNPDATTQFLDETETAQRYIDELSAQGIGKIVVLSHYQYGNEVELAKKLTGVDVVVGGDSHTLLGDGYSDLGLSPKGAYPTVVTNKDGNTACVVQAWQYSQIVGELDVTFDGDIVTACKGTPHMPLADSFKRKNADGDRVELEGDTRTAVVEAVTANALLSIVNEDESMKNVVSTYSAEVDNLKTQKIAEASENLCLERIPGQGYNNCDTRATPLRGSDVSGLVAYAFLNQSNLADIAIQNAGGVRTAVSAGDFTTGMAYELLPFANTLVNLKMTGQQIKDVLEEALTYAYDENGSTGAYPYGAGIRWNVNGAKTAGQRFSNLEVQNKTSGEWSAIDLSKTYTVVSNSYTAGGKDGYLTFGTVAADANHIEDTYLDYAQSFVDYVTARNTFGKLVDGNYSTQDYATVYRSGNDVTGIWWDPSKDGQGVSIKDSLNGEVVSGVIYTYDSNSQPIWYTFAANLSGNVGTGEIYSCTATPAGQAWDNAQRNCGVAGSVGLTLNGESINFSYTPTGGEATAMALESFVGIKTARQTYDNLYWDSNIDGQGLYLARTTSTDSNNVYPMIWYTYDSKGNGIWYYLDGKKADGDSFALNFDVLKVTDTNGNRVNSNIGTATFTPVGQNPSAATFSYTVDGNSGTLNLTGFDF